MKNYSRKKGTLGKVAYRSPSRLLARPAIYHPQPRGVRFGKKGIVEKQ
ncbi:hypothetical protein HY627_01265 [Candidatus Uhrbacteria bacterium]|nr:hypothetical protein [Candidatus Uhrbacteria bacterium]